MALHRSHVAVDSHDPSMQARWWAETLGWPVVVEEDDQAAIEPTWMVQGRLTPEQWDGGPEGLVLVPVPEGRTLKNRLHIDLAPHLSQDRNAAIADLLRRGATRVDLGQDDDVTWTVLADSEGSELCALSAREC